MKDVLAFQLSKAGRVSIFTDDGRFLGLYKKSDLRFFLADNDYRRVGLISLPSTLAFGNQVFLAKTIWAMVKNSQSSLDIVPGIIFLSKEYT